MLPPSQFRPRTDPLAIRDADALREQLKRLVDSRGPINPLGDYVLPPKRDLPKEASSLPAPIAPAHAADEDEDVDHEAATPPSLAPEAQQRLKAQPPSVLPSELAVVGLYPPPRIRSNAELSESLGNVDDGFRPVSVITANYNQSDPAAMIPPSIPMGSLPAGSIPSAPPPIYGDPIPGSAGAGGIPGAVLPAPPSYVVPQPSPTFSTPAGGMPGGSVGTIMPPGADPMTGRVGATSNVPYSDPLPTYSRSGTIVNSAPFVSPPPTAQDARWMVSPAVYRQAAGANCGPATPQPTPRSVPGGMVPNAMGPGGMGTSGVAPGGAGSPFVYAPPAAMPPQTIYSSSNGGYVPLVGFGQGANAQLGRGLWGQPTAYVDGQHCRNFLRYIFP